MNHDIDEIALNVEQLLLKTAKTLEENAIHNDAAWTKAIFTNLTEYAYDLNLSVWSIPNDIDPTINEWLYDFVISEGSTPIDIDKVLVVLECEWNRDFREIKYDFHKLVQSRSMLRIMIFQSRNPQSTIDDLVAITNKSETSQPGDRYLLACWNDDDGFTFSHHTKW